MAKPLSAIRKSGDRVLETGLYRALHSTPHSLIQAELYFEGCQFRACKLCPLGVFYRLDEEQFIKSSIRVAPVIAMAS
jgi:hypothetical protein